MSEHRLQAQFVSYLTVAAHPDSIWFAIPNAGRRSYRVGSMMRAEGLVAGVADMALINPRGQVHFIEFKNGRAGRLSDHQRGFAARCERAGVPFAIARTFDEAVDAVRGWGLLR